LGSANKKPTLASLDRNQTYDHVVAVLICRY
jgi:hypothetical protein